MLNEFIKELKENQDINYKNNLENRIDIDYVIEKLEDIEPSYETIKKDIESLEDYEKSDLIVDLVKNGNPFYIMDNMEYLIENSLDKNAKYDILNTLLESIKNDIKREYETETKKKDDAFYNVKLNSLDNEYGKIEEIAGTVYDLGF
jgi:hypothetical protein